MDNDLQEMLYLNARISTNARIIEELKAAASNHPDIMCDDNMTHGEHASEEDIPVLDDPLPVPAESTPSEKSGGGKKSAEKKALIKSLVEQGLTYREISEQTGIPYGTVSVYGKEFKVKQDPVNAEPEDNTDGHLCKTCKYRGKGVNGCDYIILEGHSRGCTADRCTVYKKGPRLANAKQALSL